MLTDNYGRSIDCSLMYVSIYYLRGPFLAVTVPSIPSAISSTEFSCIGFMNGLDGCTSSLSIYTLKSLRPTNIVQVMACVSI